VFSSTAAVYGNPAGGICDEELALAPVNPYGTSKLMSEWMLRDQAASSDFRYVSLRYFNVAGSDLQGRIGQSTRAATLLIKVACEAIVGKRPHVAIFGTDYDTPDGTGVRDYVHVEDVARAHVDALDYLRRGGAAAVFTCGYSRGYSVREVLESVQRIAGSRLAIREEPRRPGRADPLATGMDPAARQSGRHRRQRTALGAQAAARALVGACAGHSVTAVATGLTASRSPLA
jgi:UDP-glucose 4-epimerase